MRSVMSSVVGYTIMSMLQKDAMVPMVPVPLILECLEKRWTSVKKSAMMQHLVLRLHMKSLNMVRIITHVTSRPVALKQQ